MSDQNPEAEGTQDGSDRAWIMEGFAPGGGAMKDVELPSGPSKLVEGIRIVDIDSHFSETADLWRSRAPAALKDRMPRIERFDKLDIWFIGDTPLGPIGCSVIDPESSKLLGKLSFPNFEEMNPATWDVKSRLEVLDRFGIWAQLCYSNSPLTGDTGALLKVTDEDLRLAIVRIANDAYADHQRESGNRLYPQAVLPWWDSKLMVEEARRATEDLGLTGITLFDRPERIGLPSFLEPYWEPLFELCNANRIPVNFHIGTNLDGFQFPWKGFNFETRLAIASSLFSLGNAATIANFLMSGLFDRFTDLKVVSVESGLGWVPFLLESLEHQMDEMMPNDKKRLERRPTEYFRDHIYVSYWFEEHGPRKLVDEIGVRNILFETDYPHPTSLYPGVLEKIEKTLGHLDEASRKRILQDNAAELYQLKMP